MGNNSRIKPKNTRLVSYDRLIDEKYYLGDRQKERWSVEEAAIAVRETVAAAKYPNPNCISVNQDVVSEEKRCQILVLLESQKRDNTYTTVKACFTNAVKLDVSV